MLQLEDVSVEYGGTRVLWNVGLEAAPGTAVAVMGPNGSGKSTILKAIVGLVRPCTGRVSLDGVSLAGVPTHQMVGHGIALVMERRCLFPHMTVEENVAMGAFHPEARKRFAENLDWVHELFPVLAEKRGELAMRLSGGQQQMVAIARGLMGNPRYLLMDEPFLGLAPRIVEQIGEVILSVKARGIAVIFNEQNAHLSFSLADRGYLLESGRIVVEGSGLAMLADPLIRRVYLGDAEGREEQAR